MFDWFEKTAPIRVKFQALLAVHSVFSGAAFAATCYAVYGGGGIVAVAISGAFFALTVLAVLISSKLICTPYVNTVLRMESLARGDTKSVIQYTDYRDCVGRMTKAMAVFRDNADKIEASSAVQQHVVTSLAAGLEQLSAGNLSYTIEQAFAHDYETLRQSFNQAVAGLDGSLGQVATSSQAVLAGSSEIRSASEDLSRRTEQQAASLEETAAAMAQVASMVAESARNANDVRGAINAAHKDASDGGAVVREAVSAMGAIEKSSQEISSIINVIDGIAFQTNLLALNAGVEAARAGEAGKGFAVVANEVRALAQRSADAAKDIKDLINTSTQQVSQGVGLVGDTGKMLDRILTKIDDVNTLINEMAASAEAQAANVQQVNGSVTDMDKMTQQNAAMVEETTAAARNLAGEADELAELVARFKISSAKGFAAPKRSTAPAPGTKPAQQVAKNQTAVARPRAAVMPVAGNLAVKTEEDWTDF
jgi:methyl-accepting chemotaxis protein